MRKYYYLLILLVSCTKPVGPQLNIVTTHYESVAGNKPVRKDSVSVFDADYLEITLSSYSKKDSARWWEATREFGSGYKKGTEETTKVFVSDFFKISDATGKPVAFANSTDFLNYMSKFGYEMVMQGRKEEFSTDYTFKKSKN